ncbi:hypothetical protein VTN02DRAFT_805 [Thermoascus thermophilus]
MADDSRAPLLDRASRSPSPHRPSSSVRSAQSDQRRNSKSFDLSSESTPLLRRVDELPRYLAAEPEAERSPLPASRDSSSCRSAKASSGPLRWPTVIAIVLLGGALLAILGFGFAAPAAVKEYAEQSAVFTPTGLSIESATANGLRARVQGDFLLDASRVRKKSVRGIGRFGTWIAREVQTGESEVQVYLPDYGNVLIGTATLPSLKVNIRNGRVNHLDFRTDLAAGDAAGIRPVISAWLEGRLGPLRIKGAAAITLRSGLLNLGTQVVSNTLTFTEHDLPAFPEVNITKLNVHEVDTPDKRQAMAVDVSVAVLNISPLSFTVPPLGFNILVPNCSPGDSNILVANATTGVVLVQPNMPTAVDVNGLIRDLPNELTTACPGKKNSPLDSLVGSYIQGQQTIIYIRGADAPSPDTPRWITELLKSVTVPLPVAGHAFDNLIKSFSMTDVHFSFPDPLAKPGTPDAQPKVSALVKALIGLPKQMNFAVDISRVRANASVHYKGKELGFLDLSKWQTANTTRVHDTDGAPALLVWFNVQNAPLQVTDEDTFTQVIQDLIFGGETITLRVTALVDAEVKTALAQFVIREIPAEGGVAVKPPYSGSIKDLNPRIESLKVWHTTESSILAQAKINFTNPTNYSATIPLADFMILHNGTAVAQLLARNLSVAPGLNSGVRVDLLWNPKDLRGERGETAGRDMLSRYVSGLHTNVTIQTYEGTIPALPNLGRALSSLGIEIQVPRLHPPGSPGDDGEGTGDDDATRFIQAATLHLVSSTAIFTLLSPFAETTFHIDSVDAVAYCNHIEPVGKIDYYAPFAVPPGFSETPRIPVDLDVGGVGYDVLKRALGGDLQLDAVAKVGVRIGEYSTVITYRGKGIGAKVRL